MVTFEDVKNNEDVRELIKNAQKQLDVLGYTEHSACFFSCRKSSIYFRDIRI